MANNRGQKPVVHTKKHVARLQRERQQTRIILGFFIAVLVVLVGLLVGDYVNVNFIQLQKPVAKVGDVELSRKDFQTRVRLERNNLLSTYQQYYQISQMFGMDATTQLQQIQTQLDDNQTLGQGVIDSMVNEELIRQEAAKRGITVTDAEVEAAVQGAFQYYPDGSPTPTLTATPVTYPTLSEDIYKYITPSPTMTTTPEPTSTSTVGPTPTEGPTQTGTIEPSPSPTITVSPTVTNTPIPPTPTIEPTSTIDPNAPTETPLPTSTPYTAAGFKDQYGKGLTHFAKYGLTEEQYRTLFKTDLLRQKLYDQVTADVSDVQDQVWARHILVADEASALAIIERLKNGEDFGKLASELSTDTGSAAQGGDLGWFSKGTMVAAFEDAAFSLKVGEISAPVKSDYGYHIIQVMARQTRPLTADELKTAKDAAFNKFLTTLRTTYDVQIMTDWLPYVPTDPSFVSIATEAAITQSAADRQTQQAK